MMDDLLFDLQQDDHPFWDNPSSPLTDSNNLSVSNNDNGRDAVAQLHQQEPHPALSAHPSNNLQPQSTDNQPPTHLPVPIAPPSLPSTASSITQQSFLDSQQHEQYLSSLLSGDFSSPSTYAPTSPSDSCSVIHLDPDHDTDPTSNSRDVTLPQLPPERHSLYQSHQNGSSQTLAETRPHETMPTTRKRTSGASALANDDIISSSPDNNNKRRRIDGTARSSTSRPSIGDTQDHEKDADIQVLDLVDKDEVPEEAKQPPIDKRHKLWSFQCPICMDDVTGLTVTHCGHMFCSECLQSALSVEATRNSCPICRQKIELLPRQNYTTKTKGYHHLELKFVKRDRKGKQSAG